MSSVYIATALENRAAAVALARRIRRISGVRVVSTWHSRPITRAREARASLAKLRDAWVQNAKQLDGADVMIVLAHPACLETWCELERFSASHAIIVAGGMDRLPLTARAWATIVPTTDAAIRAVRELR